MIEAYRIFFPIGLLFGVYGIALWIFFWLGWLSFFPALVHAQVMVGGFMYFFVVGFLGTAVPRLTQSRGMSRWEFLLGILLAIGIAISTALRHDTYFYGFMLATMVFLITFLARRRVSGHRNPPPMFVMVISGLLSGLVGVFLLFLQSIADVPVLAGALGRLLFLHGMMLSLVLGLSGFLLPVLFERKPPPDVAAPQLETRQHRLSFLLMAILIPLSFVLEAAWSARFGNILRAVIGVWMALVVWRLHVLPPRSVLAWSVWSAAWSVVIGLILQAILPAYFVHAVHVQLIGGYSVLIFAVASRVSVSHGGYDLQLTRTSKILAATTLLLIFAWATRVFAPVVPRLYVSHLAYASITWIAAMALWAWAFLPKIYKVNALKSQ